MRYYLTRRSQNTTPDLFEGLFRPLFDFSTPSSVMKTDVCEVGDDFQLHIDIPGFEKEQISLKFEDGYLTVSATAEQKQEEGKYLTRERKTSMSRSYYVGDVEQDSIKAKYEKGVLVVTFPKQQQKISASSIAIE